MNCKLYIKEINKFKRFFVQRPVRSCVSGDVIDGGVAILVRLYDKHFGVLNYVCSYEELQHIQAGGMKYKVSYSPSLYQGREFVQVSIVARVPPGSYLFTNPRPGFRQAKGITDCFHAADVVIGSESIVDRTVHSRIGRDVQPLIQSNASIKLLEREE